MSILYYILVFILGFIIGSLTVWIYNQIVDKWKIAKFSFGLSKKVVSLILNTFRK